jgi:DNA repair exonuclease SbcCD ATPase subunit
VKPALLSIKVFCVCGQKYAFEVQPQAGKMPVPVNCPVCERDGTEEANKIISKTLNGETRKLPPPSVNTLLNSAQSSLAPQLLEALKDAVVQELAAQRRELLAAQQTAAAELTELARRLEKVQTPLLERLHAYEQRVTELEKELGEQSKEYRELLKLKIEELREQVEAERTQSRVKFN